jgi:hypothetical protein
MSDFLRNVRELEQIVLWSCFALFAFLVLALFVVCLIIHEGAKSDEVERLRWIERTQGDNRESGDNPWPENLRSRTPLAPSIPPGRLTDRKRRGRPPKREPEI